MAFRFPLQSVLRVRAIRERVELQKLQLLAAQAAALRAALASLAACAESTGGELRAHALIGVFGCELQFQARREETLALRLQELSRQLLETERAARAQQARYLEARRGCEALSTLRAEQLAAYTREEARRLQQTLDELFLLRRGREASS